MENKIIEMLAEFNIENYELSSDDDCKMMAIALNQLLSTSDYTRVDASVMPDKDRRYFAISSELEEESVEFFEGRWLVEDISNSSFNDVKYWLEPTPPPTKDDVGEIYDKLEKILNLESKLINWWDKDLIDKEFLKRWFVRFKKFKINLLTQFAKSQTKK